MDKGDKKVLNKSIMVLLIVIVAFVIVLVLAGKKGSKTDGFGGSMTQREQVDTSGNLKQEIINIDNNLLVARVADSEESRKKGLAGTHFLNENSGMWFVFEEADAHGFWMKDMKNPIDIAWVDSFGQIVHMEENLQPETYPQVFTPPVPAQYVLEVSAGYFERNEIEVGDSIFVTPIEP